MFGKLDFEDLPFDLKPLTSRMVLLVFLFSVKIHLLNLVNSLAISDTRAIMDKVRIVHFYFET